MERILQTHRFGPHRVDVLERGDNEDTSYLVLVDGIIATDIPLRFPPGFEEVVWIYARSCRQPQTQQHQPQPQTQQPQTQQRSQS